MINKKKSDIRVHVHEHNLLKSDGEEAYYVKTIHIHPLFLNPGNQDYSYADVGLMPKFAPFLPKIAPFFSSKIGFRLG